MEDDPQFDLSGDSRELLPPPSRVSAWLRRRRDEVGLTQAELADRANISPSQISHIESPSRDEGMSYHTLYRLQQALIRAGRDRGTRIVDVLERKQDRRGPEYELVRVAADETVATAVDRMDEYDISQVPVFDDDRLVGSLTMWGALDVTAPAETRVEAVAGDPFPIVATEDLLSSVETLLQDHDAVLVRPSSLDRSAEPEAFAGILTPADLAVYG